MISLSNEFIGAFLSDDNPFRESITYTPTGGTAKTIYALVKRGGAMNNNNAADKTNSIYDYEIVIANDATSGIATITTGKDKISMAAPELNETAHTFMVVGIIGKTGMAWKLGLRL